MEKTPFGFFKCWLMSGEYGREKLFILCSSRNKTEEFTINTGPG